ncbi:hypothetical protein CVT25_003642 [Psilocybe cyanescens]|uniref:Uncharacterized protein n=1 Tax=Psilocybe cyanescens TaxID=93625 RepID=A0A409WPE9_PSICY|nr:hypothetical protein CVT25_003642 [Psilocybe cyanescens]
MPAVARRITEDHSSLPVRILPLVKLHRHAPRTSSLLVAKKFKKFHARDVIVKFQQIRKGETGTWKDSTVVTFAWFTYGAGSCWLDAKRSYPGAGFRRRLVALALSQSSISTSLMLNVQHLLASIWTQTINACYLSLRKAQKASRILFYLTSPAYEKKLVGLPVLRLLELQESAHLVRTI